MNKLIFIIPALIFAILAYMTTAKIMDELYPKLISEPLPYMELREFSIEQGVQGIISTKDFPEKTFMLNIFNSTCRACKAEHPQLMVLAQKHGLSIYGVAYDDQIDNIINFLTKHGNPYEKIALASKVHDFKTLDMKGTPASFIINANGKIRYRHMGIISPEDIEKTILPMINKIEK